MEITTKKRLKLSFAGALSGVINGFFGGGGGMMLVPLLSSCSELDDQHVLATSIAAILPVSICSAVIYFLRSGIHIGTALPYLVGGFMGGLLGGIVFKSVPPAILKKAFALIMIYGGIRFLI